MTWTPSPFVSKAPALLGEASKAFLSLVWVQISVTGLGDPILWDHRKYIWTVIGKELLPLGVVASQGKALDPSTFLELSLSLKKLGPNYPGIRFGDIYKYCPKKNPSNLCQSEMVSGKSPDPSTQVSTPSRRVLSPIYISTKDRRHLCSFVLFQESPFCSSEVHMPVLRIALHLLPTKADGFYGSKIFGS